MRLRFLFLLLFTLYCSTVYCDDIDGRAFLKKGREELDCKKYEDAIKSLLTAEKEFTLLGDYAALWLSDAYHETGNHGEALKTIRSLLKNFPDSPLRKKVRMRELTEAQEVSEENMQQLFESFIKDYPKDSDIKYAYARWLQKNNADASKPIFKEICISACSLSAMACSELSPSDMQGRDLIDMASNLMKFMDYSRAESVLRTALEKDDGSLKNEILKNLGLSLFKQKRYSEAAEEYEKAGEKFWKVYSLYRAGGKETFNSSLEDLQKSGDARAGFIFLAVASDKRRDGEIEEALKIYQNVLEQYPIESENAMWGIGWTYFMSRAYEKAADTFAKLYEKNRDSRYLYWKVRSLEASGKDVKDLYHTPRKRNGDFYSVMSFQRIEGPIELLDSKETMKSPNNIGNDGINSLPSQCNPPIGKVGYRKIKKFERAEVLSELGLSRDALSELIFISKTTTSIEDILYIGSRLQDLREFKYLVSLADKLPNIETVRHLRYPCAYWDIVELASEQNSIDPFLVLSVMKEESSFDPNAKSTAGALGLMQIMPQTAFRLNRDLHIGIANTSHVWDIKNNIHIGTFYLSTLIKEFGSYAYALAAYNAGEEKVRKWAQKGNYRSIDEFIEDIPYNETRNYVKKVMTTFFEYKRFSGNNETVKKSEEMGRL